MGRFKRKKGSGGVRKGSGAKLKPESEKVKGVTIYLKGRQIEESIDMFGGITAAYKEKVLPCLPSANQ